jgi:FkbM family methyltransferase
MKLNRNFCIFPNDDYVNILLLEHPFTYNFKNRPEKEAIFRRINTFLIKNNYIKNNIIDLGAWIGDNSVPWAKNIHGIVYAIDPSSDNCKFINKMCELNNITNVKTIQTAISDKNEILTTHGDINHCSFICNYLDPGIATTVNAVSLNYLYEAGIIENI